MVKVLAMILSSVLSFASLMVMTRYVGSEYGIMMWGFSFVAAFNAVSDLGFSSAHIREISSGEDQDRCITTFVIIKLVLTAVAAVAVLSTLPIQGFMGAEYTQEMKIIIVSFVVYYVIFNLTGIMTWTYMARQEVGKDSAVVLTESAVRSSFLIILAVAGVSASLLSASYIIGGISALAVCLLLFRNVGYRPKGPLIVRKYITFAAPLAVACMLMAVVGSLDRVMIGLWYGNDDVGLYSAAMGVIYAMTTIGTVVGGLLLSHFSKLNSESKTDAIRNTFWTVQRYTMMLILPATAFLVVFGVDVSIVLFGSGFSGTGGILSVLVVSVPIVIILNTNVQLLNSFNKTYVYGKIAVIYSVITILLFMLTIPESLLGVKMLGMGTIGAALSVAVGNVIFLIMVRMASARITGIAIYPKIYIHAAALAASLAVAYLLSRYVPIDNIIIGFFALLLTVAAYFSVLIVTREFSRNDIRFMREVLDIRDAQPGKEDNKK